MSGFLPSHYVWKNLEIKQLEVLQILNDISEIEWPNETKVNTNHCGMDIRQNIKFGGNQSKREMCMT